MSLTRRRTCQTVSERSRWRSYYAYDLQTHEVQSIPAGGQRTSGIKEIEEYLAAGWSWALARTEAEAKFVSRRRSITRYRTRGPSFQLSYIQLANNHYTSGW